MSEELKVCENPGCKNTVKKGRKYCSQKCVRQQFKKRAWANRQRSTRK